MSSSKKVRGWQYSIPVWIYEFECNSGIVLILSEITKEEFQQIKQDLENS